MMKKTFLIPGILLALTSCMADAGQSDSAAAQAQAQAALQAQDDTLQAQEAKVALSPNIVVPAERHPKVAAVPGCPAAVATIPGAVAGVAADHAVDACRRLYEDYAAQNICTH